MPALTPVTLPASKTDARFAVAINSSGQVAGTIENEHGVRRAVRYRKAGGFGLYVVNAINDDELVIGARYTGKQFSAAVMKSN